MDPTGEGDVLRQTDEPLHSGVVSSPGVESSATLTAEEFESWTLLDRSPKRSSQTGTPMDSKEKEKEKVREPEKDRTSDENEEDVENEEEAEEEAEVEEEDVGDDEEEESEKEVSDAEEAGQVDISEKPSGVELVKEILESVKRDEDARDGAEKQIKKKRANSERSLGSHDGCSSDGISVISESEGCDQQKLHLNKEFNYDQAHSNAQSPEKEVSVKQRSPRRNQLKRSRSDGDQTLVPNDGIVPWKEVNRVSVVLLSIVVTAAAAVLVGNSRLYQQPTSETDFQHEQRISELELENNILKNEMNKLKHLYTRTELEDQVQQAEFEWKETMEKIVEEEVQPEPEPEPEPSTATPKEPEQPKFRKVPPQDDNIKRRVVWSGDDDEPMLVADKDYVLPEFCYNKNAVQNSLFSEYSAKYCDIRKHKIAAKQRKADYAKQHKKYKEPKDYKQFIHPTAEEIAEYQRQARIPPVKPPSLSPFDFDFSQAYESIKTEGAVIIDSLVAILDLDPEPEWITDRKESSSRFDPDPNHGYAADDEASSTTVGDSTSTDSEQPSKSPSIDEVNWENYPTWVREKYETKPEMHKKLKNKASLLWDWENKKNQFLNEVGLTTLEEVDWKTEDELQQQRQQYKKERREHDYEHKKYDGRKGNGKYDERKEWSDHPRNGNARSTDHKNNQKDSKEWIQNDTKHKDWKVDGTTHHDKEWKNDNKPREQQRSKEIQHNRDSSLSDDGSYLKQYRDEDKRHKKDWKESSGERDGKHYKKEWKESSGDREYKNKDRKQEYRKNGDSERSSGDGKNRESKDHTKNGEPKTRDDSRKHRDDNKHRESSADGEIKDWKDHKMNGDRKEWDDSRKTGHSGGKNKQNNSGEFSGDGKNKKWKDHKKHGEHKEWDDSRKSGHNGDKHRHHGSDEQSSGEGAYLSQYREEYRKQYKPKEEYNNKQHHNRRGDDDDDDDDDHYKHHDRRGDDNHYRKSQKDSQDKRHKGKEEHWDKHREEKKWHDREQQHHSQERRR